MLAVIHPVLLQEQLHDQLDILNLFRLSPHLCALTFGLGQDHPVQMVHGLVQCGDGVIQIGLPDNPVRRILAPP